jgi:CRISPR-associated endonuclease Cas1
MPDRDTSPVKILRAQALAGPDGPLEDKGLEVSRYLLTLKLRGQSANAFKLLDNPQIAMKIDHYTEMLSDATTYQELGWLEAQSANLYFAAWQTAEVRIPWSVSDLKTIPDNWHRFLKRKSTVTVSDQKNAVDPINAMLNYAYSIGYAEARIACVANALNPQLGFMHADSDTRDSLALDILEVVRPDIDAYILGLLGYGKEPYKFNRKMFYEPWDLVHGTVRLLPPLTHEIAGYSMQWQDKLTEIAREVAGILGAPVGKSGRLSHTLQAQKTEFQSRTVNVDEILSVEVYESFKSLLPPDYVTRRGNPVSNRNVLAGMIYMEHHRKPWAHIPPGFNLSHRTLKNRRLEWQRYGTWDEIWSCIQDIATKPIP